MKFRANSISIANSISRFLNVEILNKKQEMLTSPKEWQLASSAYSHLKARIKGLNEISKSATMLRMSNVSASIVVLRLIKSRKSRKYECVPNYGN